MDATSRMTRLYIVSQVSARRHIFRKPVQSWGCRNQGWLISQRYTVAWTMFNLLHGWDDIPF